jgi:hypothetical protein
MTELLKLKPLHSAVAREMAVGLKLGEICKARGLNYTSWQQITSSELFKNEIQRLEKEIEDQFIDDHCSDPVLLRLKTASLSAAERLALEVDNTDSELGGKAATRIAASQAVLKITGYEKQEAKNVIVLNLSESKLNSILQVPDLEPQPERILGNA